MTVSPQIEQEYSFALIDDKGTITAKNTAGEVITLP